MCTVSVLRQPVLSGGEDDAAPWRVAFNRGEQRARPHARPPERSTYDGVMAAHPIDPLGGGTWIAVSSAGLVFALLNGYREADDDALARRETKTSRGLIIPTVLSARTNDAATRVQAIDPSAFLSFRLGIIDDDGAREVVDDGRTLACRDPVLRACQLRVMRRRR